MKKILINGEQVDLKENTRFESSFQVMEISALTTSKSDSTSTILFPPTEKNKRIFGVDSGSSNRNDTRYKKIRADVINNGTTVMGNASCVVHEHEPEIRCNLFRGVIDLFKIIGDELLSDLDFSDLNHFRTRSVMVANRNNTSGFIYAMIDFNGMNYGNTTLDCELLLPCVFFHTIMERIMERTGYSLSGRILSNSRYLEMVMPMTTILAGDDSNEALKVSGQTTSQSSSATSDSIKQKILFANLNNDPFGTDIIPCFSTSSFSTGTGIPGNFLLVDNNNIHSYEVKANGLYKFQALVIADVVNPLIGVRLLFYIEESSVSANSNARFVDPGVQLTGGTNFYNTSTPLFEELKIGQRVTICLEIFNAPNPMSIPPATATIIQATLRCTQLSEIESQPYNSTYDMTVNMPEMKQVDFLKGVFGEFQVAPIVDPDNGTINLWSYSDGYKDIGQAADYSGKIDFSTPVSRQSKIPGFARRNLIKYSNDDEPGLTDLYGSASIVVDDVNIAEEERTIIELPFSLSRQGYGALKGIFKAVAYIPVFDNNTKQYRENVDTPRVLILRRYAQSIVNGNLVNVNYNDSNGTTQVNTNMAAAYVHYDEAGNDSLFVHDGNVVDGIITSHYNGVVSLLDKAEVVEASIRLKDDDIANLDFTKPVYIEELKANFIINKIDGYESGGISRIELIRM